MKKAVCRGFSKSQLRKGIRTEMEHTNKRGVAKKIATAHLSEFNNYYTYLPKAEKQMARASRGKCQFRVKRSKFLL